MERGAYLFPLPHAGDTSPDADNFKITLIDLHETNNQVLVTVGNDTIISFEPTAHNRFLFDSVDNDAKVRISGKEAFARCVVVHTKGHQFFKENQTLTFYGRLSVGHYLLPFGNETEFPKHVVAVTDIPVGDTPNV